MHLFTTSETEPLESIKIAFSTLSLNDQTDRTGNRTLWRVAHMWGQQKNLSFPNRHIMNPAAFGNLEQHVPLQLIEEFFYRIIMKINPGIGAADDHDYHPGFFVKQLLVCHGRF